ncbi:S-layer homology domain-containing protein, partial [Candidatus Peregrinibacteria bacterium]|nr:S-layer homology domain-containing protein [Candidatus Peregrinibacteria bacterium]
TPTKTGYTFSEWNSSSDGSGTTYDSSTVYSVAGSITLYAQWTTITYTLNYSTGGDGVLSGGTFQTVVHGGSGASVTATPNSGYKFIRWSDGITDNPRTDTNVFADLSVSAVFDYITPPGSGGGYRSVVNSPVSNIIPGTEKTTTKTTDTKTSVSDQQFPDTDSAHPAYQSLINLNKKNIIGGDALTGNARLNDFINRAEMAKLTSFVQKSETNNALSFPDVNKEIWYYSFINTAQKKGIMGGYGDGFFRPDNFLNYAEFFKILAISLGYTTKVEAENQALESGKEWYAVYIELLDNNQMLPDWAKEKSVADFVTRGEAFMLFDGASGE